MVSLDARDVRSLLARSEAPRLAPRLCFRDPTARAMAERLGLTCDGRSDRALRRALERTLAVDALVVDAKRHRPLVVAVHPGLCSRARRLDDGVTRFVDLQEGALCRLLGELLGRLPRGRAEPTAGVSPRDLHHQLATSCSPGCTGWMRQLSADDAPLAVLVAEDVAARYGRAALEALVDGAARFLPSGGALVLHHEPRAPEPFLRAEPLALETDAGLARYPGLLVLDRTLLADGHVVELVVRA